ncbi:MULTISPECIES: hypothetical protein [unclassified Breznakia]|uniref:hypothetical protein n=1 Tax=unclassified Breznakia TaxID=2623764 RepID=UPI0024740F8F|nr:MULTISPECIES: hypothetical protein [unclassified Breznakia]MDH6366628.1 hypothetical protein [Breznakia sp. PH1-1]MDH6403721.1 hypothetical protein [Breznakia sp. PF1-11]MDH6411430.1 hypothetical protein [Breznakia sp. PFB1-11]MDH6413839.1 hypothetical protein [Breznakia sp. PFB1-14]MDH6416269.1 hypothetical protein [Breznakia sp. PFB1-4]
MNKNTKMILFGVALLVLDIILRVALRSDVQSDKVALGSITLVIDVVAIVLIVKGILANRKNKQ